MAHAWISTDSEHFTARHDEADAGAAAGVLAALEVTRARLAPLFAALPRQTAVVLHASDAQLLLARPDVAVRRALTAPAARRYVAGAAVRGSAHSGELHVLTPTALSARASGVPDSGEMLARSPSALYARLVVLESNAPLRRRARALRWAWLLAGAGAWFSGQTAHARPAIGRRLRDGGEPSFPPGLRDAELLGGTVIDLLAREEGERAAAALAMHLHPDGPRGALRSAFAGRALVHTEGTWRAHLAKLAERASGVVDQ